MEAIVNISCKDVVTKHTETSNPKIVPPLLESITGRTKLLHLTLKNDGQIVVNSVSEVPSITETQSTSSTAGTPTFSPTTPAPKVGVSKRAATENPGTDKKMKRV
ncbi:hypothetical protein CASFOL_004533 [Castilleja foliolosa]|uniref:Uncharacterized protein n=1 Tax=Castilleja foliolosa TaxID=1961234 RepID=A0ABD3EAU0_9LAMI